MVLYYGFNLYFPDYKECNYYLIHLSTIWIPYSEVPSHIFCLFFYLIVFFLLICWYSLYIGGTNDLLVMCVANIFSQLVV